MTLNKEQRKNISIIFLTLTTIILSISLILTINSNKNSEMKNTQENQERIEILNSQMQEYKAADNNSNIEKENVCRNFLKTYYSVHHSTSKAAALSDCRIYLTDKLYNKLSPADEESEYTQNEVDIDYTSTISIKEAYQNQSDPNELIVQCTIKRTVNDMQNINEYFVLFKLEKNSNEWLIDNFELISVQGG